MGELLKEYKGLMAREKEYKRQIERLESANVRIGEALNIIQTEIEDEKLVERLCNVLIGFSS